MSEEKKLNGTVIVTYRCNARCSMCNRYKAPSKPEEEISIETIKKLPKMYFTNITGGEPFIRTDLKAFDKQGIGYVKTAVGDKYVYEYMAKNGCRIGGEQSGHIIFSKYASTGDGILTSLKMMEVMLAKKMPMSKLAEPLKIYPQVLENVRVTDKKTAQNDPASRLWQKRWATLAVFSCVSLARNRSCV